MINRCLLPQHIPPFRRHSYWIRFPWAPLRSAFWTSPNLARGRNIRCICASGRRNLAWSSRRACKKQKKKKTTTWRGKNITRLHTRRWRQTTSPAGTYLDLQAVHHVLGQVRIGCHEDGKRRLRVSQTEPAEQQFVVLGVHRRPSRARCTLERTRRNTAGKRSRGGSRLVRPGKVAANGRVAELHGNGTINRP